MWVKTSPEYDRSPLCLPTLRDSLLSFLNVVTNGFLLRMLQSEALLRGHARYGVGGFGKPCCHLFHLPPLILLFLFQAAMVTSHED